jgi:hypothetical protein
MKIWLGKMSGGSKAGRGLIVGIAALALMAFLLGNHSYQGKLEDEARRQASAPTVTVHKGDAFYYFRSGMWKADVRTFMAVCRYLADPGLA